MTLVDTDPQVAAANRTDTPRGIHRLAYRRHPTAN